MGAPDTLIGRLRDLAEFARSDCTDYVRQCVELMTDFGLDPTVQGLSEFHLEMPSDVTQWQIGDGRTVLLRGQEDLYILSGRGAKLWNDFAFGRAHDVRSLSSCVEFRQFLQEVATAGLVTIHWDACARAWSTPAGLRETPVFEYLVAGDRADSDSDRSWYVAKYPHSACTTVGAALNFLTFANYVENDREDAIGAAGQGNWDLLADSLRRQIHHAAIARLSVEGIYPLDVQKDEEYEVVLQLQRFEGTRSSYEDAIRLLGLRVRGPEDAQEYYREVAELVEELLGAFMSDDQRRTYSSATAWFRTMLVGTEWAMLADHLGVALPLEEFQTLVSVAQGRERLLMKQRGVAEQLLWTRALDFERELEGYQNAQRAH
jgi:hypothetical protein